jgi:glutathione peroxidase
MAFKLNLCLISLGLMLVCFVASAQGATEFSDFSAKDLDGKDVSFDKYKGKCVLVINTGSGCTLTNPNMEYLNKLRADPEFKDLEIVAFPSDSFNQEKKSPEELKKWFEEWNAKYDVYGKVDVNTSEVYQFLSKAANNKFPSWNYGKSLAFALINYPFHCFSL